LKTKSSERERSTAAISFRDLGVEDLDTELKSLFEHFSDQAKRFSIEMEDLMSSPNSREEQMSKIRLYLARNVFSKWSIEIITILYRSRIASYSDVKNGVGKITSRILSQKLTLLEKAGLVERRVIATRPPTVRYSLTERGINVARIAEPVFLYAAAIERLYQRPQGLERIENISARVH
jgi:DNA-binding HxlR family transcriptional regulator